MNLVRRFLVLPLVVMASLSCVAHGQEPTTHPDIPRKPSTAPAEATKRTEATTNGATLDQHLLAIESAARALNAAAKAMESVAAKQTEATTEKASGSLSLKDVLVLLFGASGWLGVIYKTYLEAKRLKKEDQRREKEKKENRRAVENEVLRPFEKELNEPHMLEIIHTVKSGSNDARLRGEDLRNLPAILEGIAAECDNERVSYDTVKERYKTLFVQCANHEPTWRDEKEINRATFWGRFFKYVERLQK